MKRTKAMRRTQRAFTIVEVMVVVLIMSILFALSAKPFILARESGRSRGCSQNLKNIDGAKEQYALDNKASASTALTLADLISTGGATGYLKKTPVCNANGVYDIKPIGTNPICSRATGYPVNAIGGRFPHTVNGK